MANTNNFLQRFFRFLKSRLSAGSIFAVGLISGLLVSLFVWEKLQLSVQDTLNLREDIAHLFESFLPHIIVVTAGFLIGLSEVQSVFKNTFLQALLTRWGITLLLFNSLTAELVYILITLRYESLPKNLTALSVGIGFPTLLRTRFTLKKSFDPKEGDFTFGLDQIYQNFLHQFKDGIDKELLPSNSDLINALTNDYSTFPDLFQLAQKIIGLREHLTPEEKAKEREKIEAIFVVETDESIALFLIAKRVIELGGKRYINRLLRRKLLTFDFGDNERKLQEMISNHSLEQLLDWARNSLSDNAEDISYLNSISADQNLLEDLKKAAISELLISRGVSQVTYPPNFQG